MKKGFKPPKARTHNITRQWRSSNNFLCYILTQSFNFDKQTIYKKTSNVNDSFEEVFYCGYKYKDDAEKSR